MTTAAPRKRHARFDRELRRRALAEYRRSGSYRKAAERLKRTPKRVHELVHEGLRLEMAEAVEHDERNA